MNQIYQDQAFFRISECSKQAMEEIHNYYKCLETDIFRASDKPVHFVEPYQELKEVFFLKKKLGTGIYAIRSKLPKPLVMRMLKFKYEISDKSVLSGTGFSVFLHRFLKSLSIYGGRIKVEFYTYSNSPAVLVFAYDKGKCKTTYKHKKLKHFNFSKASKRMISFWVKGDSSGYPPYLALYTEGVNTFKGSNRFTFGFKKHLKPKLIPNLSKEKSKYFAMKRKQALKEKKEKLDGNNKDYFEKIRKIRSSSWPVNSNTTGTSTFNTNNVFVSKNVF